MTRHIRTKGRNRDGRTNLGPFHQHGSERLRTKGSATTFCGAAVSDEDAGSEDAAATIRLHRSIPAAGRPAGSIFWEAIASDFANLCPACVAALEASHA